MDFKRIKLESWLLFFCTLIAVFGAWLLARHGAIYLSPDETANAIFAESFADDRTLFLYEPLNPLLENSLFPRSAASIDGRIMPTGFVGLPALYGMKISVLGSWALPFLTAVAAAIAVFFWRATVAKVFGREVGWWAAILLALHPAWIYYTARGLLPNVLFTSLLIYSVFFLIVRPFQNIKKISFPLDALLAGAALGLALFVRTSEALWIAAALAIGFIAFWKTIGWQRLDFFVAGVIIMLAPLGSLNTSLYGAPWKTGYTLDSTSVIASSQGEAISSGIASSPSAPRNDEWRQRIENVLRPAFPFGLHPRGVWRHVRDNAFLLYWWMALLNLAGFVLMIMRRVTPSGVPDSAQDEVRALAGKLGGRTRRTFLIIFFLVTGWLAVMYGSWKFNDNPDPNFLTIANSYSRYWLPVFVLATVFAALTCTRLESRFSRWRLLIRAALIAVVAALGIQSTFFFPRDGLLAASAVLERSVDIRADLLNRIEPDAIVIADRGDKLLFPYRRVRVPLRDATTLRLIPRYLSEAPLYYYGLTLTAEDLAYFNDAQLGPQALRMELVKTYDAESLYRIFSRKGLKTP
jgi:hypothetical protein